MLTKKEVLGVRKEFFGLIKLMVAQGTTQARMKRLWTDISFRTISRPSPPTYKLKPILETP